MNAKSRIAYQLCFLTVTVACSVAKVPFTTDGAASNLGGDTSKPGSHGEVDSPLGGRAQGGSRGAAEGGSSEGGLGGGGAGPLGGPAEVVFRSERNIESIAANDTHVYWVDYGTTDKREYSRRDGKLLRMLIDGGDVEEVATGLPGPLQVNLSQTHAYIRVDETQHGDEGQSEIWKLPLAGGPVALVVPIDHYLQGIPFSAEGEHVYWINRGKAFEEHAGLVTVVTEVSGEWYSDLQAAGNALYLSLNGSVFQLPLTGGGATRELTSDLQGRFVVSNGYLIRIINPMYEGDFYLARMPLTGGPWVRFERLTVYPSFETGFVRGDNGYVFAPWGSVEVRLDRGDAYSFPTSTFETQTVTVSEQLALSGERAAFYAWGTVLYKLPLE
jgi:hypothetical protein